MHPALQEPGLPGPPPASGRGIQRRRAAGQSRVGQAEQLQQLAVEVGRARCHQIDDRHADLVLEQGGTFGDEGASVFGPVLVGRADDLDGGDEAASGPGVVNADLVNVGPGQVGRDGQGWLGWSPDRRGDTAAVASGASGRDLVRVVLISGHVDLDGRAEVDLRLGDIA